jgi:hypothetical protein
MINRIKTATAIPDILFVTAISIAFHRTLQYPTAIRQHTAVAVSNTIWLPPTSASLPNIFIVTKSNPANTRIGTKDNKGEGILTGRSLIFML